MLLINHQPDPTGNASDKAKPMPMVAVFTLIYGVMTLIGLAVIAFGYKSLEKSSQIPTDPLEGLRQIGAAIAAAAGLLMVSHAFEAWFQSYRRLRSLVMQIFGPSSVLTLIYLAALSATAEEILFRGALQPFLGVAATSIIFGLMHIGPGRSLSAWTVWTMGAGVVLGLLFDNTGSLLTPILTHFMVNAFSLVSIQRSYRRYLDGVTVHLSAQGKAAEKNRPSDDSSENP